MPDYRWQVEIWDPAAAKWTLDGNESLATGIARRFDGTAEDLADRLLRNWTNEPSTASGRLRATVWPYDPSSSRGEPAATTEITRPADAEPDPYAVTGWFITNIGPTLHYTLTSPAGHVLDYSRDPDGNVRAQIKARNHWHELDERGTRCRAVLEGVREYEAGHPDLAGYNNPQAASTARPAYMGDGTLSPQEMTGAYQAAHFTEPPWLTRKAWENGELSNAAGTVRTSPWYLAAIAAKKDGQPMTAVPRYIAAAQMDAAAGRLRDHRNPGDGARNVADALGEAAAALRADDLTKARAAISQARKAITAGSSLHRILTEHETPVINLASSARLSGPPASQPRVTGRAAQHSRRHGRGR